MTPEKIIAVLDTLILSTQSAKDWISGELLASTGSSDTIDSALFHVELQIELIDAYCAMIELDELQARIHA